MRKTTQLISECLSNRNISFDMKESVNDENGKFDVILVGYDMDNMPHGTVAMFIDDTLVKFYIFSFASIPDDKKYTVLNLINKYNSELMFPCFYIDSKRNTLNVAAYLFLTDDKFGELCYDFISSLISYTQDRYPEIMKAIW